MPWVENCPLPCDDTICKVALEEPGNERHSIYLAILCLSICAASLTVAAKQPGSQRWEREIQAFEAADQVSPPPQGAILFVGSSTIRMWKRLAEDFLEYKVLNRGFGGCQIADCTYYAERIVIPYKPRLIVLRAGGNDIQAGKTPEQVQADFQAFVKRVRVDRVEVLRDTRLAVVETERRLSRSWQPSSLTRQIHPHPSFW